MDEKMRDAIDGIQFDAKKCGEIIVSINKLFADNNCSPVERQFIISVVGSTVISDVIIDYLKDKGLVE
ncbi:hypothetical protein LCGC14_1717440 [marine sediment metagenome]|uniref:Uncharacterized protein n=1 Tax=marine sediment metagenome TaxID=412755 RepID=A0A0F9HD65_9ZZZZ